MSAYSVRYNHAGSSNEDPHRPYHTYGPGLNVLNMQIQGWLDLSRVYRFPATGSSHITLRPLHRRDLPGYLAARVGETWIEFRMNELWDSAIERPVMLLHRSDFVRIAVDINAEAREATVHVTHRPARQLEPALPFGGVTSDGGGLIWTPGRGWVRVPPRSPLYAVLEQIAEIEQLQTLTAAPVQQMAINTMTTQRLAIVRDDVSRILANRQAPKVPATPLSVKHD